MHSLHNIRAPVTSAAPHVWSLGVKTHSSFKSLVFKQGSTPRIPKTTSSNKATTSQYKEECSTFFLGTLLSSQLPLFFTPLTIVKNNLFSATYSVGFNLRNDCVCWKRVSPSFQRVSYIRARPLARLRWIPRVSRRTQKNRSGIFVGSSSVRHSVSPYVNFTSIPIPNYCRPCAQ